MKKSALIILSLLALTSMVYAADCCAEKNTDACCKTETSCCK